MCLPYFSRKYLNSAVIEPLLNFICMVIAVLLLFDTEAYLSHSQEIATLGAYNLQLQNNKIQKQY